MPFAAAATRYDQATCSVGPRNPHPRTSAGAGDVTGVRSCRVIVALVSKFSHQASSCSIAAWRAGSWRTGDSAQGQLAAGSSEGNK